MTSYLISKDPSQCYGCRSCEQVCPKNAIVIEQNAEGFLYPRLTPNKCIECGLCMKACPYDSPTPTNVPRKAVAAQHKDAAMLLASSSGGVFFALAEYALSNNGYVAGCVFDETFTAGHILTNQKELVEKMRGSKYVQSDMKNIYTQIQNRLKEGTFVLFTGTPCQVDGLRCFLGKEYHNLLTVDIICHGVPSPRLLDLYIKSVSKSHGMVTDIKFRDKQRNGWCSQGSITYSNRTKTMSPYNSSYYYYYLQNSISRMSCYSCKYASTARVGDLTIGDYWNILEELPVLDTSAGVSAVLINTPKGAQMFEKISSELLACETNLETVVKGNKNLHSPSPMPASRNDIYSRIADEGYDSVARKVCKYQYVRPILRKYMPKGLKKLLKTILR